MPKAFTRDEVRTMMAVFDTVIPSMSVEELLKRAPGLAEEVDIDVVADYAAEVPSKVPGVREELQSLLAAHLAPEKIAELKTVLGLMRGYFGSLALTGSFTPFESQPIAVREKQLLSWKTSVIPTYRKIYDSLVKLGIALYLRNSATVRKVMRYDPKPVPLAESYFGFEFLTVSQAAEGRWDAIIVGSGSGGGVAAKAMAEAGMRVLVIEKGAHYDHSQTYDEPWALEHMYECGVLRATEDGSVGLVAGSVFGGGSTVNWAASLQAPAAVREGWAKEFGLPYFASPQFQADMDYVCAVMGVCAPTHNVQNQMLLEGARRMGYTRADVPQNAGGAPHGCGHNCANGCVSGGKKGGVHAWLADAARAGARFVRANVRRIDFAGRAAVGVTVLHDGRETSLPAPRVIVAGGSIHSPALLLRSRVRNPRIGASIYLHPTNYVYGVFKEDTHPTEGQILTSVVSEFANLTPGGYGPRIETGIMQPVVSMSLLPWAGGAEHKGRLARHSHMLGLIVITRDKDCGRVKLDAHGEPAVHYSVSATDAGNIQTGTVGAAAMLRALGAQEIIVCGRGVPSWKDGDDWDTWTELVRTTRPASYGSAHQMASNRMSARPADGACDPDGALYGVSGVWVADASVLPTSSGVNPMVTSMAVAHKVARGVVEGWQAGTEGARGSAKL
ncbi:long-chain fatty alcohol dehydrogenase [Cutaneotrichosporon oleaginosum]|uniref:Long-chain-alcohol oxidase n=1 Tax=Cutaneotrichosporon oleaginosum TaxID=879819 RepID=A0A0J0XS65_9TREE|nr:long-chain fatty alcohol dehydrogenase [Cutaneotrichosporon oleaginosum]KLT43918.1 long-chain fatty alcohol dehydrogenase [Cutaneotrichosporon oleaginosum]TXT04135.1 hypothetical protein COLE_07832 [Cutaneotrichosporon oleaginosum]